MFNNNNKGLDAVARDFSTIQTKRITLPRQVNNFQTLRHNLRRYEPHPMVRGTRDMRGAKEGIDIYVILNKNLKNNCLDYYA